jgi:hypothetical protein
MPIEAAEVATILSDALPEFREAIEEHRREWPGEPMLYSLVGLLFQSIMLITSDKERLAFARRVYEITDKMLVEGAPSVRACFSIEMIEPLWGDAKTTEQYYPGLEGVLGPAGKRDLAAKREWQRRYHLMKAAVDRLNAELGRVVFEGPGIGLATGKAIVRPLEWSRLSESAKDDAFDRLKGEWKKTTALDRGFIITGPRESGFELLRGTIEDALRSAELD